MSDETLKAATRKRGSLQARLQSFNTYVDKIQALSGTIPTEVTLELNTRLEKIIQSSSDLDAIQDTIESLVNDNELQAQYNERCKLEELQSNVIARAQLLLGMQLAVQSSPITTNPRSPAANTSFNDQNSHVNAMHRLKLPTIKLPPFGGSYDDWLEFSEMYESLIHNRDDLKDIEKYQYLRLSLQGEASQIIKSIEFTETNYNVAWTLLRERYDNHRILINNHVTALFNVETVHKESATRIRHLVDTINKHLRALKVLKQPTEHWDTLLVHLIVGKLDTTTGRKWEEYRSNKDVPTFEELKTFLRGRADLLESIEQSHTLNKSSTTNQKGKSATSKSLVSKVTIQSCPVCKSDHAIYSCAELQQLSTRQRIDKVKQLKLCINCLKSGHFASDCKGSSCRRCSQRHNTLLHLEEQRPNSNNELPLTEDSSNHSSGGKASYVLLSTVSVRVFDKDGNPHSCRALLDSGSQSNFITNELRSVLQLPITKINHSVSGIGQSVTSIHSKAVVKLQSHFSHFSLTLPCLVIPNISGYSPSVPLNTTGMNIPEGITLADPDYDTPGTIQMLIGASIFWDLTHGQIKLGRNLPTLQSTQLGWIIAGPATTIQSSNNNNSCHSFTHFTRDIRDQLQRFWEVEEGETRTNIYSKEEDECEQHFLQTTTRLDDGRFKVCIPFKASPTCLGESRQTALKRFLSVERALQKDPTLKEQYVAFMSEYLQLGHMTEVSESETELRHYIPHHAVVNPQKTTTRVRVVFDASNKTSSGVTLNDIQKVGPRTQNSLAEIIYVFACTKLRSRQMWKKCTDKY